jgi:hypothetical protein
MVTGLFRVSGETKELTLTRRTAIELSRVLSETFYSTNQAIWPKERASLSDSIEIHWVADMR